MRTTDLDSVRAGLVAVMLMGFAACGDESESLGTTGMMSISASLLAIDAPPCPAGAAHRNACCRATGNGSLECGTYPRSPLHRCASGWTAYPVANTCCDLADSTRCAAPPAPSSSGACVFVCPPGYAPQAPITETSGVCCASPTSNGEPCFAWGGPADGGPSSTSCENACPSPFTKSSTAPGVCVARNPFGVSGEMVTNPIGSTATSGESECALTGGEQGGHAYSLQCSSVTQILHLQRRLECDHARGRRRLPGRQQRLARRPLGARLRLSGLRFWRQVSSPSRHQGAVRDTRRSLAL